jgi:hypothetical protein
MENDKTKEQRLRQSGYEDVKLSYTIFPKDATVKEIYEYLTGRAEEAEKAGDDESGMDHEGGRVLNAV